MKNEQLKVLICANRIVIYRFLQKGYKSNNAMELASIEGDTPVFVDEYPYVWIQWVGYLGNDALKGR